MTTRFDISESPSIIEEVDKSDFHVLKSSYSHTTRHLVRRRSLTLNDPRECFRIPHRNQRSRTHSSRSVSSTLPSSRPSSRCSRTSHNRPRASILTGLQSSNQSTQVTPPLLSKSPVKTAVKYLPDLFYRIPMICAVTSDCAEMPNQENQPLSPIYLVTHRIEPSPFKITRNKSYTALDNYYLKSSKIHSEIPALLRHDSLIEERGQEWCGGDLEPKTPNIDDYPSEIESTSEILQKVSKTPRGRIAYQEHYRSSTQSSDNKLVEQTTNDSVQQVSFHTAEGYFVKHHNWKLQNPELWKSSSKLGSTKLFHSELVRLIGLYIRPSIRFHLGSTINLTMNLEDEELYGIVRVANMNYHKSVIVRVSWNNWFSYTDYKANYLFPNHLINTNEHTLLDYFQFQIPLKFKGEKIEFAVKYSWGSADSVNQTVWDNNDGRNYTIEHVPETFTANPMDLRIQYWRAMI